MEITRTSRASRAAQVAFSVHRRYAGDAFLSAPPCRELGPRPHQARGAMDPTKNDHRQIIANARMMRQKAAEMFARAKDSAARARATLKRLRQARAVGPAIVTVMSPNQTRLPPPRPRCRRVDRIEEEGTDGQFSTVVPMREMRREVS